MTDTTQLSSRTRRRSRLLLGLTLALMGGSVLAVGGSLAVFTSTDAAGSNAFTSGTVVIGVSPGTALLTAGNMLPGDVVAGTLAVSNTGTAQLRYAMTTATTNVDGKALASQLVLTVKSFGTNCATFDGTTLYTGSLASGAFGSPTQGAQAGDRTLNAVTNENLCFEASLPLSTGNAYQAATTTATFTFTAEQTANNP